MKKILWALPLFAGAAWAGTTAYSGAQTEPAYNLLLEQMDSQLFSVSSRNYDAGFMNSTAITEVRSKEEPDSEPLFLLNHKINHSPVSAVPETARFGAANIITTLDLASVKDEELKQVLESFDTGKPFVVNTDISIDGDSTSKITINAVDQAFPELSIKAEQSVFEINTKMDGHISGEGDLNDIEIINHDDNKLMQLRGASLDFNLNRLDSGAALQQFFGDAKIEFKIDELNMIEDDTPLAKLKGASFNFNQNFSDEPFVNFGFGTDSIETEEVPLESLNFSTALSGFSVEKIKSHTAFLVRVQQADNPEDILFSPEGIQMLRSTFTPGTKLAMKLKANSDEGDADGDVSIWFVGNGEGDGYSGMATLGDLARTIAGSANIELDKSLLQQSPAGDMLEDPVAQAYLTITDDKVIVKADLDKLVLKLNEQMLPLELMAGDVLKMPLEFLTQM